jgi:hypothetical protein
MFISHVCLIKALNFRGAKMITIFFKKAIKRQKFVPNCTKKGQIVQKNFVPSVTCRKRR